MKLKIILALTTSLIALSSSAMIVRHDVDKNNYLVNESDYPAVFPIQIQGAIKECVATLISEKWAITAAHCTALINLEDKANPHELVIGQKPYHVANFVIHPNYGEVKGIRNESGQLVDMIMDIKDQSYDVALIELSSNVTKVEPIDLYKTNDEIGQTIQMLGWGDFGDGVIGTVRGQSVNDGKFRQAFNKIDGFQDNFLTFSFDHPNSGQALSLEGINGAGDSGGPALINRNGKLLIAGISSGGGYPNETEDPEVEGKYGWLESYTRVSTIQHWIERTITETHSQPQ
jgi:hypothetical protein